MQDNQREDVPRIHIDSVQQWERVKSGVRAATYEIAERSGSTDENISTHLNRWLELVFEDAKPNLRANGRDLEDYEGTLEETEPYDEVLDRKIWTLSKERIAWDRTLAERRRQTPREIERLVSDLLRRQREAECVPEEVSFDIPRSPPYTLSDDEVLSTQEESMNIAMELQQSLPALLERSERAKSVTREVTQMQTAGT